MSYYNFYNSKEYKEKQSAIVKAAWKRGSFKSLIKKEERICKRDGCGALLTVKPSDPKVFCSQSCAAMVNNTGRRRREITYCQNCRKETIHSTYKYCGNHCQFVYQYNSYINKWKEGKESGLQQSLGVVSRHVKRYLREKYGNRCCLCGWSEINPKIGIAPLTADHIDGNWQNNKEENLRLICPNCDSLTPTYKNLNRGKGRKSRMVLLKKLQKFD